VFLSTVARQHVDELTRHLATPDQVDAAILRLQKYRARSWPKTKLAVALPPDVLRELAAIHNVLVQGDEVIISPASHQAAAIAAAMCSVLGRPAVQEVG
jgi:hypothetical protein